jgi:hypothetical protein
VAAQRGRIAHRLVPSLSASLRPAYAALATLVVARSSLFAGRILHAGRLFARVAIARVRTSGGADPFFYETLVLVRAALLAAELALCQGALDKARVAAQEARQLGGAGWWRWERSLAWRLEGQCALAGGRLVEAEGHLRTALALQEETGAALEAARTRLVLAETLVAQAGQSGVPDEARVLLAAARTQFATSGAALDLARAEQLAVARGVR